MKTINGKYHYQVKDLVEELKEYPQECVVFAIWSKGTQLHEKPIYKTVETADGVDPKEIYLYLGDDRQ